MNSLFSEITGPQENCIHDVMHLAVDIGQVILESGGETYRVEEAITIVCRSYGFPDTQAYVVPTGIMATVIDSAGKPTSVIRRIRSRSTHFERLGQMNELTFHVRTKNWTLEKVREELQAILQKKPRHAAVMAISAGMMTGFFALFFGGKPLDFLPAFFVGATSKLLVAYFNKVRINDFFANIVCGSYIVLQSHLIALLAPQVLHGDKIATGSIMLLVPGLAITNAVRDSIAGDLVAGVARAIEASLIAAGIAFGAGIALQILLVMGVRA
jgi:uncharacterized membrane protein YjjP (DUF1212 family)